MAVALGTYKLVTEPGGAAALAAALQQRIDTSGRTIVVVATGGNVDADLLSRALMIDGSGSHASAGIA